MWTAIGKQFIAQSIREIQRVDPLAQFRFLVLRKLGQSVFAVFPLKILG